LLTGATVLEEVESVRFAHAVVLQQIRPRLGTRRAFRVERQPPDRIGVSTRDRLYAQLPTIPRLKEPPIDRRRDDPHDGPAKVAVSAASLIRQ
jgi:hypothetical protein